MTWLDKIVSVVFFHHDVAEVDGWIFRIVLFSFCSVSFVYTTQEGSSSTVQLSIALHLYEVALSINKWKFDIHTTSHYKK